MGKKKNGFAGTTNIGFVLDGSGSMMSLKGITLDGYNEWLNAQRQLPGKCLLTTTIFDTTFKTVVANEQVQVVTDLTPDVYTPEKGGNTALYDAIAHCVIELEQRVTDKDRALIVILTDGRENSSREHDRLSIKSMIQEREQRGNWTFTYLSASPSAFQDAASIGTQSGNVTSFVASREGMKHAMGQVTTSTQSYRGASGQSTTSFYSEHTDPDSVADEPNFGQPQPRRVTKTKTS